MTPNLKVPGFALLTLFVLSAVTVSAASANNLFTSAVATEKTDLTGSSINPTLKITPGGALVTCEKETLAGTAEGVASEEITVHPVFDGPCDAATLPATVDTDGCDYILTGETDTVGGKTDATVEIECTPGDDIKVTIFFNEAHTEELATMHIAAQGPLLGVTYDNGNTAENGSGSETVTVTATVSGIHTTCTGPFCFLLEEEGESSTAEYKDDAIVTGYEDNGTFHRNSTTHVWSGTHGGQVHINVSKA